jgi:hypothetical protein
LAYNPETDVSNYYRVTISGSIYGSQAKYSSGQYNRDAVNQLFGEGELERQYLVSHLKVLSADTDEKLKELKSTLEKAESIQNDIRKEHLHQSYATAAGLIERYRIALDQQLELKTRFEPSMARAVSLRTSASTHLKNNDFTEAAAAIREIQVIINAIRIALDGKTIVRFFDGDGQEIDVTNKKEVIFVATDTERFTQALLQLTEAKDAEKNIAQIILGEEIQKSAQLKQQSKANSALDTVKFQRVTDILKPVSEIPADKSAKAPAAQTADRQKEANDLKEVILEAATTLSGNSTKFGSPSEIRAFASGLEVTRAQ